MKQTGPPRAIIHVGLPKTATTTLQRHVFSDAPGGLSVGKPNIFSESGRRLFSESDLLALFWSSDVSRFGEAESKLRRVFREASKGGKTLILSHEGIGYVNVPLLLHREFAHRISRAIPEAEVLLTIRNQLALLRSVYMQSDRMMYAALGWPRNVTKRSLSRRLPFRDWIESLIRNPEQTLLSVLDYDALYETYAERIGPSQVTMIASEELGRHTRYFSEFTGHTEEQCAERLRRRANPTSRKLSTHFGGWHLQRLLDDGGLFSRFCPDRVTRFTRALAFAAVSRLPSVRPKFSSRHLAILQEFFGPSNQRVAERLGIDLRRLGYPVGPSSTDEAVDRSDSAPGYPGSGVRPGQSG